MVATERNTKHRKTRGKTSTFHIILHCNWVYFQLYTR